MLDIDKIAHAFDHDLLSMPVHVYDVEKRLSELFIAEAVPDHYDLMFLALSVCKAAPVQRADIIRKDILMRLTQ